jgi:hypothetical protein
MTRFAIVSIVCICLTSISHGAAVSWVSGASGTWQTATNWSSNPALPGSADDVTINQPGTLTITLATTPPAINSLNMAENLFSNTLSDLFVGAGGGTISGTVTFQAGKLISQTGTLQLQNTVNSDVSGLKTIAGGKMLFSPGVLPTINAPRTFLESDGANSLLDLSGVTTFTGGNFANSVIVASSGGTIELENVSGITTGATYVEATGANSKIDLTTLTSFTSTVFTATTELRATNGGKLITPNLTSLGRVNVQVDGATSSIDVDGVTNADFASFRALNGAVVAPTALTSYTAGANSTLFQADGTNSRVDMSSVTTFNGGTFVNAKLIANSGGRVELDGVATITTGATLIDANGTGSVVDVSALTTFTRTNVSDTTRLRATGGGSILSSNLTTLGPVRVEVDGAGSSINLGSLTNAESVRFAASNGGLIQPSILTSYSGGSAGGTMNASGSGAMADFSSVTTFNGGTFNRVDMVATGGGRVELDNVTQITTGATNVEADGAGSKVVLTDLTTFTRDNFADTGRLRANNGGEIETPSLTTLGQVNVDVVGATSQIDLSQVTNAVSTTFLASTGGMISMPSLTSYIVSVPGATTIRADGAGSLIDMSAVTSFSPGTFNNTDVLANGGTIDLSGVTTVTTGGADIRANTSGLVDLSALATFSPTNNADSRQFIAETSGIIQFHTSAKTTITNTAMFMSTGGELHGQEIDLGAATNFQATGTIVGSLTNSAGTLRPGFANQTGTLDIEGDFEQSVSGSLRIDATSVSLHDVVNVDGDADLAGNLHITPLAGFTPVYGTGIDIINVTGSIDGTFTTITWDGFFGWRAEYFPNVVRLIAEFGADFDEDGDVDGDDLLVWQTNYTMAGASHTDGDANDDGRVNGRDFLIWQKQYTGSGPLMTASVVPEPGVILLLLPGVFAICTRRCGIKT